MEQKAKITGTQIAMLMFIFVTSTITIYVPGYTATEAKFEVGRLLPVMENGLLPIVRGSIAPSSW